MFIPMWVVLLVGFLMAGFILWAVLLASGRNPLPFPDPGSRIFTASSAEAKDTVVTLLSMQ